VIEDLNSTNGIYVKSKRVRRHYLNDGDVVVIGKHELIYVDERWPHTRRDDGHRTGVHITMESLIRAWWMRSSSSSPDSPSFPESLQLVLAQVPDCIRA